MLHHSPTLGYLGSLLSLLKKQYCTGHVSSLLQRRFPSAPKNHPHGCPQVTTVLLSLTLAGVIQHLACICSPTHVLLSATQPFGHDSDPQPYCSAASFLHLIFNFSPKAAKPHVELQSTTWTRFQHFAFNICPCICPRPGSLTSQRPPGPCLRALTLRQAQELLGVILSPHLHTINTSL